MSLIAVCSSVKGPELINMYVGQSEENVRKGEDYEVKFRESQAESIVQDNPLSFPTDFFFFNINLPINIFTHLEIT